MPESYRALNARQDEKFALHGSSEPQCALPSIRGPPHNDLRQFLLSQSPKYFSNSSIFFISWGSWVSCAAKRHYPPPLRKGGQGGARGAVLTQPMAELRQQRSGDGGGVPHLKYARASTALCPCSTRRQFTKAAPSTIAKYCSGQRAAKSSTPSNCRVTMPPGWT